MPTLDIPIHQTVTLPDNWQDCTTAQELAYWCVAKLNEMDTRYEDVPQLRTDVDALQESLTSLTTAVGLIDQQQQTNISNIASNTLGLGYLTTDVGNLKPKLLTEITTTTNDQITDYRPATPLSSVSIFISIPADVTGTGGTIHVDSRISTGQGSGLYTGYTSVQWESANLKDMLYSSNRASGVWISMAGNIRSECNTYLYDADPTELIKRIYIKAATEGAIPTGTIIKIYGTEVINR